MPDARARRKRQICCGRTRNAFDDSCRSADFHPCSAHVRFGRRTRAFETKLPHAFRFGRRVCVRFDRGTSIPIPSTRFNSCRRSIEIHAFRERGISVQAGNVWVSSIPFVRRSSLLGPATRPVDAPMRRSESPLAGPTTSLYVGDSAVESTRWI